MTSINQKHDPSLLYTRVVDALSAHKKAVAANTTGGAEKLLTKLQFIFQSAVNSDPKDWDLVSAEKSRDTAVHSNKALTSVFKNKETGDSVTVSETVAVDEADEMYITHIQVTGSYKGNKIDSRLVLKPEAA